MFNGLDAFNQNIGSWNTAAVTTMKICLWYALVFDQDIASWNTAAVTNMESMFNDATVFNQDINTSGIVGIPLQ